MPSRRKLEESARRGSEHPADSTVVLYASEPVLVPHAALVRWTIKRRTPSTHLIIIVVVEREQRERGTGLDLLPRSTSISTPEER